MKKIKYLLIILLAFITFSFTQFEINADTNTDLNISNQWVVYNYYATTYGMRISDYDIPDDYPDDYFSIIIDIPDFDYNVDYLGGIDSQLVLENTSGTYTFDLIDILGINMSGRIKIYSAGTGHIFSETGHVEINPSGTFADGTQITFSINVMQTFTSVPSGFYYEWQQVADVFLGTKAYIVNFLNYKQNGGVLDGLEIHETQALYGREIPQIPTDPTPPSIWSSRTFVEWRYLSRDENGRLDFENSEWISYNFDYPVPEIYYYESLDGTMVLDMFPFYAQFTNIDVEPELIQTNNMPTRLQYILIAIGFNNDTGYFILYIFMHIIAFGLISFMNKKSRTTNDYYLIISSLLITVIFSIWGVIPIYVIIVMSLLYLTGLGLTMKRKEVHNEE